MDTEEQKTKSDVAKREEAILEFWQKNDIFKKSLEKESPNGEFVFYEGPPTANAAPALHHLEARAFKDIIPRYKTMRGFHVGRKAGWDTHGLPVELQIEKKLGLKSKKDIETYGISKFNEACKASVWEYIDIWRTFTDRIGYWVDEKNSYRTYENTYIESLWNVVSKVNNRGLLYKDYRVVPWCTRCGTALSSHELAQGYAEISDLSVYIKFKVVGQENTYILAWTTTPWTLPGNVGLAVGEKIEYVKIKTGSEFLILAKERLSVVTGEYEIVEEKFGKDLVGLSYEPLYPFFSDIITGDEKAKLPNAFKVWPADFVTTTDGTGVVHTAVMYGQEDFELGTKVGMPKFHLVSPDGTFVPGTGFLAGRYVRETNEDGKPTLAVDIIDDLKKRNLFFNQEKHKHSYPHCWRCKTALIYYARDSWYIKMSSLRAELQKENEKVNWEPDHIKEGRFGEWIREAKDWAISRERYWGTPLPVWETADCSERLIIGSLDELKNHIGRKNKYFLVRHGESESNVNGDRISCNKDNKDPLTANGRDESLASAKALASEKIDLIVSSPFVRTRETAEIIAKEIGLSSDNIVFDDRLGEIGCGSFDGTPWAEYTTQNFATPEERFHKKVTGAETLDEVRERVVKAMYDIDTTHDGKNILIVSHGGPLNLALLSARGLSAQGVVDHYFDNPFYNAEVIPCDFVQLPHSENFEIDFHRPYIDDVVCVSETGKPMRRVKEVMDCWFDSGSMPFAQDHYPFENKDWVEGKGYPADFISEAIDQTRGWFYTLLAVGVLMERGTPYKNVVCLGHILDAQGKKMSKSIGNIVNPWDMMDKYGVDALRLWMYSVNQPGDSKNFDEKTVDDIVKKIFNPITNSYTLFALYEKDVARIDPRLSTDPLDIWILTRLDELVSNATKHMDSFKIFEPVRSLRDFTQDFSAWYIRRSRERFKSSDTTEKSNAVSVTEYVLVEIAKYMAPFAPFYADWLYREVTKSAQKESVHLESWPDAREINQKVLDDMSLVRTVVTSALELRQKAGLKVRQPLASLSISQDLPKDLQIVIADEVNVKEVLMVPGSEVSLDTNLTPELVAEGTARDVIRAIQDIRKKMNMNPGDVIKTATLNVSDAIREMIQKHEDIVRGPTSVETISYVTEKQEHPVSIGETEGSITLSQ